MQLLLKVFRYCLWFILFIVVLRFLFAGYEIKRPLGVSERYVFHTSILGPTLLTSVEDNETQETILWYDLDAGPDIERVERLESGEWVVTLVRRP
jgi:hypothetical protein